MMDGEMKYMTPRKPDKAIVSRKARIYPPDELKRQEGANMEPTEACECKAKPYDLSPTRKLSVCELGYPKARGTIAQIRDKGCIDWKLKDLRGEGK